MKRNVFVTFLVILLVALVASETVGLRPVAYRDVTSIVLVSGRMTLGRRSIVPQMTNVGRHYDASLLPSTMQCSNSGWDGAQFTWKCQAQLPNGIELDRVEVVCEDWEAPVGDATINDVMTYGSCGVEYSLRGSAPARVASPTTHTTTVTERTTYAYDNELAIIFVWFFLLIFVGWVFASICCGTSSRSTSSAPPVVHVSGASPAAPVHVTVENRPSSSSYSSGYVDGVVSSSFWRPSSWYSGYPGSSWGWGNSNHVYHHNVPSQPYTRTTTTTTSSSPSSSSSSSDSGTHNSTAFGGTRRR